MVDVWGVECIERDREREREKGEWEVVEMVVVRT